MSIVAANSLFLELVAKSGVVTDAKLAVLERQHSGWAQLSSEQLADELVRVGALTKFQSQLLLSGQTEDLCVGQYRLLNPLANLNGVKLFDGENTSNQQKVRLSLIPENDEGVRSRIDRLQQAVTQLSGRTHPYLASVFGLDKVAGKWVFASEHINGKTLDHILAAQGTMTPERAVRSIAMAASGLSLLHAYGLYHGGIQPSCLVNLTNGSVRVDDPLGDLVFGPNRSKSKTLSVSVADAASDIDFVSPEQSWGLPSDARSDIYRLGLTLHRLLCGRVAFHGSIVQRLAARQAKPAPSLVGDVAGIPPELDAVISKMTAPEPRHRYQNVSDVIRALSPWLSQNDQQQIRAALVQPEIVPSTGNTAPKSEDAKDDNDESRPSTWPLIAGGAVISGIAIAVWLFMTNR